MNLETLKNENKENVLLIDDFDRLDPEHIFRILNILSVHNDYLSNTYQNKFGFDKIIIVCDIDCIKDYYHHKYGEKANFKGYIDKFCSTKFFRFSNDEAVQHFCEENIIINDLPAHYSRTLLIIVLALLKKGKLTLRNLLKYRYDIERIDFTINASLVFNKDKYCPGGRFINTDSICIDTTDFPSFHIIAILTNIFGDFEELRTSIKELANEDFEESIPEDFGQDIIESLCLLSHLSKHSDNPEKLCFNPYNDEMCNNFSRLPHLSNPKTEFCKTPIEIILSWNTKNRYKVESSYFEGYSLQYNINKAKAIKYKELFIEISLILDFLSKKKLRNKI